LIDKPFRAFPARSSNQIFTLDNFAFDFNPHVLAILNNNLFNRRVGANFNFVIKIFPHTGENLQIDVCA